MAFHKTEPLQEVKFCIDPMLGEEVYQPSSLEYLHIKIWVTCYVTAGVTAGDPTLR